MHLNILNHLTSALEAGRVKVVNAYVKSLCSFFAPVGRNKRMNLFRALDKLTVGVGCWGREGGRLWVHPQKLQTGWGGRQCGRHHRGIVLPLQNRGIVIAPVSLA